MDTDTDWFFHALSDAVSVFAPGAFGHDKKFEKLSEQIQKIRTNVRIVRNVLLT